MKISIILEELKSNWCAFTPDDIGVVVATGATREEAIHNFRSTLKTHLAVMRDEGLSVPDVTELEIRETVAA